jgi:hypothetical protein
MVEFKAGKRAGSARLGSARSGGSARLVILTSQEKNTKYNICIYLKHKNINNKKIIYSIALNRTKYSYELTYYLFVKCKT